MGGSASSDLLAGMGIADHLFWTAQAPLQQLSIRRHCSVCVSNSKWNKAQCHSLCGCTTGVVCRLCSCAWLGGLPESYIKPLLYIVAPSPPNM